MGHKPTRRMQCCNSITLPLLTSLANSTPPSYRNISGSCASYGVQRSITCLQCCTQSRCHDTVRFITMERFHLLAAMGSILHLDVHPREPCRSQATREISPDFSEWVQKGFLTSDGHPIQKRSVEQYLLYMGQIFAAVGTTDSRLNILGGLNGNMGQHCKAYVIKYPPPSRFWHTPIVILQCLNATAQGGSPRQQIIIYLSWIEFSSSCDKENIAKEVPNQSPPPPPSETYISAPERPQPHTP